MATFDDLVKTIGKDDFLYKFCMEENRFYSELNNLTLRLEMVDHALKGSHYQVESEHDSEVEVPVFTTTNLAMLEDISYNMDKLMSAVTRAKTQSDHYIGLYRRGVQLYGKDKT